MSWLNREVNRLNRFNWAAEQLFTLISQITQSTVFTVVMETPSLPPWPTSNQVTESHWGNTWILYYLLDVYLVNEALLYSGFQTYTCCFTQCYLTDGLTIELLYFTANPVNIHTTCWCTNILLICETLAVVVSYVLFAYRWSLF